MSTAAEYGAAGPALAANCSPQRALSPNSTFQDVARLERLPPEIERARSLSPHACEAIGRVTAHGGFFEHITFHDKASKSSTCDQRRRSNV
jgi:hypothetical protein